EMMRGSMAGIEPFRSDTGSDTGSDTESAPLSTRARTLGLLAAMPEELGGWTARAGDRDTRVGLEVFHVEVGGMRVVACVSGIGKVLAARAATVLLSEGVDRGLL